MFSPKLHVRAVGYDQNVVICSRSLGKHSKAAFPSRLISRNKQLQVTKEAPLRSVIPSPIHCKGHVGEREPYQRRCARACKKVRHFHRINIHYKQQRSICILNSSLADATVHPSCNRGSASNNLLNSEGLVYYYCMPQNILHYITAMTFPDDPNQLEGTGSGGLPWLQKNYAKNCFDGWP